MSALGKRVLTTAIALPIALAVVFYAPGPVAFAAFLAVFFVATMEFLPMARVAAPSAPLKSLLVYVPLAAIAGFLLLREEAAIRGWWLVTGVGLAVTIAACTTLLGGAEWYRFATVAEYMEAVAKIDPMASDIYRYLEFDKMESFAPASQA